MDNGQKEPAEERNYSEMQNRPNRSAHNLQNEALWVLLPRWIQQVSLPHCIAPWRRIERLRYWEQMWRGFPDGWAVDLKFRRRISRRTAGWMSERPEPDKQSCKSEPRRKDKGRPQEWTETDQIIFSKFAYSVPQLIKNWYTPPPADWSILSAMVYMR